MNMFFYFDTVPLIFSNLTMVSATTFLLSEAKPIADWQFEQTNCTPNNNCLVSNGILF